MKKSFKIQKVGFVVYLLTMIVFAIFALSFMTSYQNLFGFVFKVNLSIAAFHDHMQAFNQVIFWVAVVGVASIILMYVFELRTKVCDKLAAIVMTPFAALNVGISVYGFIQLSKLMTEYKGVDFSNMWQEDTSLTEESVYVLKFTTFYIGYAVFAILLVVAACFITILWVNHIKYKRIEVLEHEKA